MNKNIEYTELPLMTTSINRWRCFINCYFVILWHACVCLQITKRRETVCRTRRKELQHGYDYWRVSRWHLDMVWEVNITNVEGFGVGGQMTLMRSNNLSMLSNTSSIKLCNIIFNDNLTCNISFFHCVININSFPY